MTGYKISFGTLEQGNMLGCSQGILDNVNSILTTTPVWKIESVVHVKGNFRFDGIIFITGGGKLIVDGDLYLGTAPDKPGLLIINGVGDSELRLTYRDSNIYRITKDPSLVDQAVGGAILNIGTIRTESAPVNDDGSCQIGETLVQDGGTVTAYRRTSFNTYQSGNTCEDEGNFEVRTCTAGVLSGGMRNDICRNLASPE